MTKRPILLVTSLCCTIAVGFHVLPPTGWVGVTRKNPAAPGCFCHNPQASDSVAVWITGPLNVQVGTKQVYTVFMKGGPARAGGFNVAAGKGILSAIDSSAHIENDELTHSFPKSFERDTVRWTFQYQAHSVTGRDTIFSVGNSVDLDGVASPPDKWNFGDDFVIDIVDTVVSVANAEGPLSFRLSQNYPNPFNPKTKISFTIQAAGFASLKIYSLDGKQVATLVNERKQPGTYEVEWDVSEVDERGRASFATGVYLYRFQVIVESKDPFVHENSFVDTEKMVYLR